MSLSLLALTLQTVCTLGYHHARPCFSTGALSRGLTFSVIQPLSFATAGNSPQGVLPAERNGSTVVGREVKAECDVYTQNGDFLHKKFGPRLAIFLFPQLCVPGTVRFSDGPNYTYLTGAGILSCVVTVPPSGLLWVT